MSRKTSSFQVLTIWLVIGVVLYAIYVNWRNDWYRQRMPPEVGIGDVVFIDGESGLREGCGVAIFELTPEAITRLQVSGVRGLNMDGLTSPGATSGDASASSLWHETPYVETGDGLTMEDSWIVGLGCAQMSPHLVTTISRAMAQPGSFYFKRYESGVLVIPAAGIAAFVYNG